MSAAERQRRHRALKRRREACYYVCAGELVLEALVARSIDAGLSVEAAERDNRNRAKVSADLTEIVQQWAKRYPAERKTIRDA